jgi:hypothetical protein
MGTRMIPIKSHGKKDCWGGGSSILGLSKAWLIFVFVIGQSKMPITADQKKELWESPQLITISHKTSGHIL